MITSGKSGKLVFGGIVVLVVGFVLYQMFYSVTPPQHADHDHAMASLNAGGHLRIESRDGTRRNLVGQPGHVLVLHFFDARPTNPAEQAQAAKYAAETATDPGVEVVFVARGDSWEGLDALAERTGIPMPSLYLDKGGRVSELCGVRRWPETLVYAPDGLLAHQARGSVDWSSPRFRGEIDRARRGVEEVH